jgi:3-isopropylmalate/(R)-2-methylmalate dehydratase small subunit
MDDAKRGANAVIEVDLENQTVTGPDGGEIRFEVDPFRKHCLFHGLDDIALTLEKTDDIDAFEERRRLSEPWLYR